jgi:superfamily II DNA or RNA helicase
MTKPENLMPPSYWNLVFDRGTLLLRSSDKTKSRNLPITESGVMENFVWDDRVQGWRGHALSYGEFKKPTNIRETDRINDTVFPSNHHSPNLQKGWQEIPLRPYQEAALLAWVAAGQRGLIGLPTGAGKTRVGLAAAASISKPTLFLVPTRVLLDQWSKSLREFFRGPVGVIGDGHRNVEEVTVCTFESAYRNMSWLGNRFGMLVVDEAHHFGGGQRDEALTMCIAPYRLGLTATKPDNTQQLEKLVRLVGPIVYELGIHDLAGKFLADFNHLTIPVRLNPVERLRYDREYALFKTYFRAFMVKNPAGDWQSFTRFASLSKLGKSALSAFFRSRRIISLSTSKKAALARILANHHGQKAIIFTADTASAFRISREFLIPAITADIGRRERDAILDDFRNQKVRAIVACRVLNEGVDIPDAEVAVILGGSSNAREQVQRIGRLLRPTPEKKALIYELVTTDTHEVRHAKERSKSLTRTISTRE